MPDSARNRFSEKVNPPPRLAHPRPPAIHGGPSPPTTKLKSSVARQVTLLSKAVVAGRLAATSSVPITKLILRCGLSPGDIVLLSAAVRDLHTCYPNCFITDLRTSCRDIWENNPFVQSLPDDGSPLELDCSYPLINTSNERPYHAIHGFIDFLNSALDLAIRPTSFKGDIYLSAQEKAWYSQVREVTGKEIPYWIVAAGGKHDLTIKWWESSRYGAVVDHFKGRIQFVQIGEVGHHHPKLDGVIDLRGKTDLRELIRLVYHAQGVLCGVTGLMHLAAAVPTKPGHPPARPCVVIAGGREPAHWEQYPAHQFIHNVGALSCSSNGGCWRDRVIPLRDGDERDKPYNLCVNVTQSLPRCMEMIRPEDVIRRIEGFFEGGALSYLQARHHTAVRRGVKATERNSYDLQPLHLSSAGLACDAAAKAMPSSLPSWQGRGIVICGGGVRYFVNAWVCINMLRFHGCTLPIEFWHLGRKEMSAKMAALLRSLNVKVMDASVVRKRSPARHLGGWELKPYSIYHSRFREVLFLDADNVPVNNPEYLFNTPQYLKSGALFWPDFDYVSGKNPAAIWRSCGLRRPRKEAEFETGQIVVDKSKCWNALRLCVWFNEHSDFYYQYLYGDKETFRLAFRKVSQPYFLIKKPIKRLPYTMCQHDPEGRRVFQHRNTDKWDLFGNRTIRGFKFERECRQYVQQLSKVWNGHIGRSKDVSANHLNLKKAPRIFLGALAGKDRANGMADVKNTDWTGDMQQFQLVEELIEALRCFSEASYAQRFDYALLLRGNLVINRHLHHNLLNWNPTRTGQVSVASLYNPQVREIGCSVHLRSRLIHPQETLTTEAMIFSNEAIRTLLKRKDALQLLDSGQFSPAAANLKGPVWMHAPSLVQRLKPHDSREVNFHLAIDFDLEWKADRTRSKGLAAHVFPRTV